MTEVGVLWTTGLMSVGAIIAAPMIALWIQRRVELRKASLDRREAIFRALWVNRRRPFYLARVDALNMVDIDFFGERKVQEAWDDLRAHYFRPEHPGLNDEQIAAQREEKFAALLYEMSQVLGYTFGKTNIRDNIYRPQLHNDLDSLEFETRKRTLDLLRSDALPVRFVHGEPEPAKEAVKSPPDRGPAPPKGKEGWSK
jgi:hypothetical protein